MGFYYYNLFSLAILAAAYVGIALVFLVLVLMTRGAPRRAPKLSAAALVLLLLPVAGELWTAWSFGQACKEAGLFVHKKVQVDGFYDDTGGALDLVRAGGYRFIEGRGRQGFTRISAGDAAFAKDALRLFEQGNPGKEAMAQEVVRVQLDAKTEALVYPRRGDSWRIEHLDRPTARYRFSKVHDGTVVAHGVTKLEWVVVDQQTGEQLARETTYARGPSWFFIGLDRPGLFCPVSGKYGEKLAATLYRLVLEPTVNR